MDSSSRACGSICLLTFLAASLVDEISEIEPSSPDLADDDGFFLEFLPVLTGVVFLFAEGLSLDSLSLDPFNVEFSSESPALFLFLLVLEDFAEIVPLFARSLESATEEVISSAVLLRSFLEGEELDVSLFGSSFLGDVLRVLFAVDLVETDLVTFDVFLLFDVGLFVLFRGMRKWVHLFG